MKFKNLGWVALVSVAGCGAAAPEGVLRATPTSASPDMRSSTLCDQSREWGNAGSGAARAITPQINENGEGRTYHFDLSSRAGLKALDASCGWGNYSECNFIAVQSDGQQYQFSDLSSFSLWELKGSLYLMYRIANPKDEVAANKRRLVKVGNPSTPVCNQIGDYSDVM